MAKSSTRLPLPPEVPEERPPSPGDTLRPLKEQPTPADPRGVPRVIRPIERRPVGAPDLYRFKVRGIAGPGFDALPSRYVLAAAGDDAGVKSCYLEDVRRSHPDGADAMAAGGAGVKWVIARLED